MEPVSENIRLLKRAYWLIKLRWIAVIFAGAATYISSNLLGIELHDTALYSIAILVALYNLIILMLLNHCAKKGNEVSHVVVKKIINVQISADLLILTVLLHFSGGIENPFIFYFIFHMIIASILLSLWDSYLQATFAVLVFGLLVLLEYLQLIPHYCLRGFTPNCLQRNKLYILGTIFVFSTALYLAVYMASYISVRLKRTERAYIEANILLQEKDHIKDEYVLRVTHDIKAHLATIQSCLSMVVNKATGLLNEQKSEFMDRAYTRTIKLTNFVKTLLKLTQMRLNDKLETDVFPLRETVYNSVDSIRAKAEEKSITLNCNVEPSVDTISGNQFSIEEVFSNLLLNAIRYTPEHGTVSIGAKNGKNCVVIEIADTGIGIPADEIGEVFDEFFRASNARKFHQDGTGLGLSIAKYIVERHGGKIWVDSIKDIGTKFWITLPKGSQQLQTTQRNDSIKKSLRTIKNINEIQKNEVINK